MSLREKSAWIALVTLLVCFGGYFGAVATGAVSAHGAPTVHLLVICAALFIGLQGVLHLIAVATTAKDGRAAGDERERLIQARSHSLGYYVLVGLVLLLGVPGHLGHSATDLLNFALLDVVVAALTVTVAQLVMFRWSA